MKKVVLFFTAFSGCLCYSEESSVITPDNRITDNNPSPEDENLPIDLDEEDDGNFAGITLEEGIINSPGVINQGRQLTQSL